MCIQQRSVHLNEFYAKLLREGRIKRREAGDKPPGLSARSVGHVHRLLHRALGHGVQWQLVQRNIGDHVSPPRVEGTEILILREEEIGDLLARLRGRSLYMIAVLGLATGMRRGEMLALRKRAAQEGEKS